LGIGGIVVVDFKVSIKNDVPGQRGIRIEKSDPEHPGRQNVIQETWLSCGTTKPSFTYTFPPGATVDAFSANEHNFALVRENSRQRLIVPAPACPPAEPPIEGHPVFSPEEDMGSPQAVEDLRNEIQEKDGW
jgi:hypothetical protein